MTNKRKVMSGLFFLVIVATGAVYWLSCAAKPYKGYTLYTPLRSKETYLIDNEGKVVHQWVSRANPGLSVYLLENGHLLRASKIKEIPAAFVMGGVGGRVEELDWDGRVVWEFDYANADHWLHHDIERMPNGNVLMIAWERKTAEEAVSAGRNPELLSDMELWPDHIIEVRPIGDKGGEIVWEWHLWDHLIQDYDPARDNYGRVAEHLELVDINYIGSMASGGAKADWTHTNSIDYHAGLDQILLSVHGFNEIWIIDHSTTTEEAAGHTGGQSGKGGDLLYRWGNPPAYRTGGPAGQQFFGQHDAKWIEPGLRGEEHILVYNNGLNREGKGKGFSTVAEIMPPMDVKGNYQYIAGESFGPERPVWEYRHPSPGRFYSAYISGAQRLPNGNTLICSGYNGLFFEVTPNGKQVWRYTNPYPFSQVKENKGSFHKNAVFRAERYPLDYAGLIHILKH
jgi:hypothetical protein